MILADRADRLATTSGQENEAVEAEPPAGRPGDNALG